MTRLLIQVSKYFMQLNKIYLNMFREINYPYLAILPLLFLYLLLGEKTLLPPLPRSISAFVQVID